MKYLIPQLGNVLRFFLQSAEKQDISGSFHRASLFCQILTFPTVSVEQIISMLMRCSRPRDWEGEVWVDSSQITNETSCQSLGPLPTYIMNFYIDVHPISNPIQSFSCRSLFKSELSFDRICFGLAFEIITNWLCKSQKTGDLRLQLFTASGN